MQEKELGLLVRKGIYPNEYMDRLEKMNDEQLPRKEALFPSRSNSTIIDAEYAHAKEVWNTFYLRRRRAYHDLNMMSMSEFYSAPLTL